MKLRFQVVDSFSGILRLRRVCTVSEQTHAVGGSHHGKQGESEDPTSDFVKQQILQAGLRSMKGDVEMLRKNVTSRGSTANVDKLVMILPFSKLIFLQVRP